MSLIVNQSNLMNKVDKYVANKTLSRFVILTGKPLSGKTYLSEIIAKRISKSIAKIEYNVDSIRSMIETAYKVSEPITYIIDNADNMSNSAKNALLKITEEPPRKAYFLLVITDLNKIPATLRSRGNILKLSDYSKEDIKNYINQLDYYDNSDISMLMDICESPAEVNYFLNHNLKDFHKLVSTIVFDLKKVTGVKSFRLVQKVKIKKEDESGFDLKFIMNKVNYLTYNSIINENIDIERGYNILLKTSERISDLNTTGINQLSLFDKWILDLRSIK